MDYIHENFSQYVCLRDAASLEGITYENMKKKVQRDSDSFIIKNEASASGGKDNIFIQISSLSEKAQKTYKVKSQKDTRKLVVENMDEDADHESWYIGIDISWYLQKYKQQYYKNVELSCTIEKYFKEKQLTELNETVFLEQFAKALSMSGRNFRRKIDRYLQGKADAIEMEEIDGQNYDFYKVLALCTPPKVGKHIILTEEMKAAIENIWSDPLFQTNMAKGKRLYRMFLNKAALENWSPIPSYSTVNRYMNLLDETFSSEKSLLKDGTRRWQLEKMIKRKRNLKKLRVMELVQGDAHTFDCWVKIELDNGKVTACKPVLVGFIDSRSRTFVGWAVCLVANAEIIKKCLIHMIYPKADNSISGVPRFLLIDNGKDFTAQTLTGRKRVERFDVDDDIKGFYKSLGIETDRRSLPYRPQSKSQIERMFGTICTKFTSEFSSYTGTLTGSKTLGKRNKDIPKMLKNDELIGIEEFSSRFGNWINETYHHDNHEGLVDQGEEFTTPIEVFNSAERYYKAAPPLEMALSLLGNTITRFVQSTGINLNHKTYQSELLENYIGKQVLIRNKNNEDLIYVYDKDGNHICALNSYEGLNAIADKDDPELVEHMQQQNRQLRRTKESIKKLQTPFEDRSSVTTDGIGREIIVLPELSGAAPKVTALPNDKQYRDSKTKDSNDTNEFYAKQAEKALAALRKLERAEGE